MPDDCPPRPLRRDAVSRGETVEQFTQHFREEREKAAREFLKIAQARAIAHNDEVRNLLLRQIQDVGIPLGGYQAARLEDNQDWEFTPEDFADEGAEAPVWAATVKEGIDLAVERGRPVWIRGQVVVQPPPTDPPENGGGGPAVGCEG